MGQKFQVGDLIYFSIGQHDDRVYGVIVKITPYQYHVLWVKDCRVWPHCKEDFENMAYKAMQEKAAQMQASMMGSAAKKKN